MCSSSQALFRMIHSLFLVNASGDIFLEKHWKSVVSRSVCDYFFEALERATEPENVPPVIPTPHHYLISVLRHRIYFVAVIQSEVPPLFVIEFLHRVVDTFQVSPLLSFSIRVVLRFSEPCGTLGIPLLFFVVRTILEFAQKLRSRTMWSWFMNFWKKCWITDSLWPQSPTSSKS